MLNVGNEKLHLCHGHGPTRPQLLAGWLGRTGEDGSNLMRLEAAGARRGTRIRNCMQSSSLAHPASSIPGT